MTSRVKTLLEQAYMVVQRLERLSADSTWAHVASGHRGALLKAIDHLEKTPDIEKVSEQEIELLDLLIDRGFELLAKAAREIGDPELTRGLAPKVR